MGVVLAGVMSARRSARSSPRRRPGGRALLLAGALSAACGAPQQPTPSVSDAAPEAKRAAPPAAAATPLVVGDVAQEIRVAKGKLVVLGDRVSVTLVGAGYAHADGDRNFSDVRLELTREGEKQELFVERDHSSPPEFKRAFGLDLAVEVVDAYSQEPSAVLLVKRAPPP